MQGFCSDKGGADRASKRRNVYLAALLDSMSDTGIRIAGATAKETAEVCRRRQADQSYMDKLFILVQGCLLEVVREQYTDFCKEKEGRRYRVLNC